MSTIFLAMDKSFSFQPASFFLTLSRTKEKSCLLPGCLNGKPKYLPKLEVGVNPGDWTRLLFDLSLHLGRKIPGTLLHL